MDVIYELNDGHIEQLHRLYRTAWWAKARTLEETRRCVLGSQICVGLVNAEQQLVGFARVLTDYTIKALIFDVIVCESVQGRGHGDKLMELIRSHKALQSVKHFELYCLPEMQSFYARHGFSAELGPLQFMRYSQTRGC